MAETPDTQRLISARRTESVDAPNIMCLVTASTEALFGRTNVVNLMWVFCCYLCRFILWSYCVSLTS